MQAARGVLKTFEAAMDKGLTLFAPNDDAFQAKGAPDVKKMSGADLVTLLEYHALPAYYPKTSLKAVKGSLHTLVSTKAGKNDISVAAQGDDVSIATGAGKSRVADTVLDNTPFCLLRVHSLLVPAELAGTPEPAPGPDVPAPSPADAPLRSPPATQPADAPSVAAGHADHKVKKASSAAASRSTGGAFAALAVCSVVLASVW